MSDGDDLSIGRNNDGNSTTQLSKNHVRNQSHGPTMSVINNFGVGFEAIGGEADGVAGEAIFAASPIVGVNGTSDAGGGVTGTGPKFGVHGNGQENGFGIVGTSQAAAGVLAVSNSSAAVEGSSNSGPGLFASSVSFYGAAAQSTSLPGMFGTSRNSDGIFGFAQGAGAGVVGLSENGLAALFQGTVFVEGDLIVLGNKSAALRSSDGNLRRLYSIESPESLFEDFGESELREGHARVALEEEFSQLVEGVFQVFLTPEGNCNGLYVHSKSVSGFEVRELNGGTNDVTFAYRVVGKRKGTQSSRFAIVVAPAARIPQSLPEHSVAPEPPLRRRSMPTTDG